MVAAAPVRAQPTQVVPRQTRTRIWPVIVMGIVVAITVFAAIVIALGP